MLDVTQLRINLVANAIDFLTKAVEESTSNAKDSLRYAILHLVDGVEILLKARLAKESWYLLFPDVDQASPDKLETGEFQSVGMDKTLDRLRTIAMVQLHVDDIKIIKSLRQIRNRIRHYTPNISENEAKALFAKTLSFTLQFCDNELRDELQPNKVDTYAISYALREFDAFVSERLTTLDLGEDPFTCTICFVDAMTIGGAGEVRCEFCGHSEAAESYVMDMDKESAIVQCHECGMETLVFTGYSWRCFGCGAVGDKVDICTKCGVGILDPSDGYIGVCDDCLSWIMADKNT